MRLYWRLIPRKGGKPRKVYYADLGEKGHPRKRVSLGTSNKAEAQKRFDALVAKRVTEGPMALLAALETWRTPVSWEQACDDLVARARAAGLVPSTLKSIVGTVRLHIKPAFAGRTVAELDESDVEGYIAKRLRVAKRSTVLREVGVISQLFDIQVRNKAAYRNPVRTATRPKHPDQIDRSIRQSDLETILAHADRFTANQIVVTLGCGLRRSESCRLRWDDVDFELGYVHIRRTADRDDSDRVKTGRNRSLPMAEAVRRALLDQRELTRLRSRYVFPAGKTSGPLSPNTLQRRWRRARDRAGLHARWHDLRHSAATWLAQRGATDAQLMAIFGWRSPAMARRYTHLSVEDVREVVSRLPDLAAAVQSRHNGTDGRPGRVLPIAPKPGENAGSQPVAHSSACTERDEEDKS